MQKPSRGLWMWRRKKPLEALEQRGVERGIEQGIASGKKELLKEQIKKKLAKGKLRMSTKDKINIRPS